jgi:hypothetical protein
VRPPEKPMQAHVRIEPKSEAQPQSRAPAQS